MEWSAFSASTAGWLVGTELLATLPVSVMSNRTGDPSSLAQARTFTRVLPPAASVIMIPLPVRSVPFVVAVTGEGPLGLKDMLPQGFANGCVDHCVRLSYPAG